jgi:ABC-type multidrug transport system permease subunit
MLKILSKELKAFLKDKRAVLLTFAMPAILITVFALAFGGGDDSDNGIRKIPLLVCDQDNTKLTKQTINDIDSVKMIEVIPCGLDSAVDLIKTGKRTSVLIFRKGFSDSVYSNKHLPYELQYDAARVQETGILQSLLSRALYNSVGKIMMKGSIVKSANAMFPPFMDSTMRNNIMSKVAGSFESGSGANNSLQSNMRLKTVSLISAKVGNVGLVQAVAGTAVMMLLFSLTGMGGGLLDEKEQGTLKRLLYSPVHPAQVLLGKMACSIIVAMFQLSVMFIYAYFVFHLHIMDKLLPLTILIFATAFAASGFGVFLATIARTRQQLQGMSTLIILSMSVIGGSMVPTFLMPQWMQNVSIFSINYWSIQGFYDILWRDLPIAGVFLTKVGILLGIGVVLTLLAFRFFRKNILALD